MSEPQLAGIDAQGVEHDAMCRHDHVPVVDLNGWTGCTDSAPDSTWSCIEFDGTGLWCAACNQRAAVAT